MTAIKRYDRCYFVRVGEDNSPSWAPVGEGFLKFEEKKNPEVLYRRYYHEEDARGDVDGYTAEIVYEAELVKGAAALDKIYEIANDEIYGNDGVIEVMTVDCFKEEMPGAYRASIRAYSVCPDKCGEGSDSLKISGRLLANGELTLGRYISSTKTFTK